MNSILFDPKTALLREREKEVYHIGVSGEALCGFNGATQAYHGSYNIFKLCKECQKKQSKT